MKGFTRPRRPVRPLWLSTCAALWLIHGGGPLADEICTASCAGAATAELVVPVDGGLAGGSRAAWVRVPARRTLAWNSAMDRHDVAVGAVDPDHDDGYEYRLPYDDASSYPVIQGYGARLSHRGAEQFTVDFGMDVGTPVHAARDGVVVLLEDSHGEGCWREECARLANFIVLLHDDGTTGEYFHLERGSARVRLGERVRRGQPLARSGNTGYTTAPHLHFGVYRLGRDGRTQSVAVRFLTREGPIGEPRTGARYLNLPAPNSPGS